MSVRPFFFPPAGLAPAGSNAAVAQPAPSEGGEVPSSLASAPGVLGPWRSELPGGELAAHAAGDSPHAGGPAPGPLCHAGESGEREPREEGEAAAARTAASATVGPVAA